jgi:DNA-binding NarL/FixJ family response regulator
MILLSTAEDGVQARWVAGLPDREVQRASDGAQLKKSLEDDGPEMVLLDLDLPGLNGADSVIELIKAHPATRFMVMSPTPDDDEGLTLVRAGTWGYCNRYIAPELLERAVIAIMDHGEVWVGRKLMLRLIRELTQRNAAAISLETRKKLQELTPREREIADMIGEGASNKLIANEFDITVRTVKAHITSIFQKLKIRDRLQLALLVKGQEK